jgi:RNA polymerase sigma-70 factor (ECF subfamily)
MSMVQSWDDLPEDSLLADETRERVRAAVESLPANQRTVITLRDVEGWQPAEVCAALEISEANQRVLLHRARGKVRQALERYFEGV